MLSGIIPAMAGVEAAMATACRIAAFLIVNKLIIRSKTDMVSHAGNVMARIAGMVVTAGFTTPP